MGQLTVSFDLDGTLTKPSFAESVWKEGLPSRLAEYRGIPSDKAVELCSDAYASVGDSAIEWYRIAHWVEFFGIPDCDTGALIDEYTDRISLFDDSRGSLERLKEAGLELIIFSNAPRAFLEREVTESNISEYFDKCISLPDDWEMVKSEKEAFARLSSETDGEIVHVGDHLEFDYRVPMSAGIDAFHIWRSTGPKTRHSLPGLDHFVDRILGGKQKQ